MKQVLAVIVTFNGMQWIEKCISSVLASTVDSRVLLIDNCSDDGTPEWVEEHYPEVIVIQNGENLGFAAANNIGFRHALDEGYRYVYLLNQDAWVFPETFAALIRVLETPGSGFGIASPMQMNANLSKMDAQFRKHCAKAIKKDPSEAVKVPFVMAAHWMVSRKCLETVGGFSPAFPHYGEDNDFINRAAFHGFGAAVVKTATAVHDRSTRKRPKAFRMGLKVINAKVAIANPNRIPFFSLLGQTFKLFGMGCLHFSTVPWKGIGEMWSSFEELKAVRKQARKKSAFLPENSVKGNS